MLPPRTAQPLARLVSDSRDFALPNKATISKWRLLIDAALMLYMRDRNLEGGRWYRYMMIDSSTQGGRDYELMICCSIRGEHISPLRRDAHSLIGLRF
jgi:hypothetical protein